MPNVSFTAPTDYTAEAEAINRRRQLAQSLQQQSFQPIEPGSVNGIPNPISWTQGLAKMLQSYQGAQGQQQADAEQKALGQRYAADTSSDTQALIKALGGRQAQTIHPDPQEAMQSADYGTPQVPPVNLPAQTPTQSLQEALPNMRTPMGQQMGSQFMAQQMNQAMAPPERIDGGDKWLLVKNGVVVGSLPKGATPDAQLKEAGAQARHDTPSGGALLAERGASQRHAAPSGNAQLSAQTTLQTHNTPSGSSILSEQGAAARHAEPSGNAILAAEKDRAPTEAQMKAAVFHSQMASATDELNRIPGYDPTRGLSQAETAVAGGRGNMLVGPNAQRAKQAQSQWAEAFLRFKTGAASTPAEVALNVSTFFPQVGDAPQTVEQKSRMRAQAERDMSMAAGRRLPQAPQGQPDRVPGPMVVNWSDLGRQTP